MVAASVSNVDGCRVDYREVGRALRFFADLIAEPPDETMLGVVETLFGFDLLKEMSREELAADHYDLFRQQVPPYAGFYLSEDGLAGGKIADLLSYEFQLDASIDTSESKDHISPLLRHTAWQLEHRGASDEAMAAFYDDLLLPFCLNYCASLKLIVTKKPFNGLAEQLADQLLSLILLVRSSLALPARCSKLMTSTRTLDLSDASLSIRAIARHILTPACSGVYLSKNCLKATAADLGVPLGFGSRLDMLENLLLSCSKFSELDQWWHLYSDRLQRWQSAYEALDPVACPHGPFLAEKVSGTRAVVAGMVRLCN